MERTLMFFPNDLDQFGININAGVNWEIPEGLAEVKHILMHEMGHTLGLRHPPVTLGCPSDLTIMMDLAERGQLLSSPTETDRLVLRGLLGLK